MTTITKKPITKKSSIRVQWKDKFENYSKEREKEILKHIKNKYDVASVRVEFYPTNKLNIGVSNLETGDVENINTPEVQEKIIVEWLKDNNIDISLDEIKRLNKRVESNLIDFNETRDNKWKVRNLTLTNFLSYGEATTFDFEKLKGLTLIQGRNFTGKTTFIEALIFLLFNTTTKTKKAEEVINRYNDADFARVEGELIIDGQEYKIIREVVRKWKKDKSSYTTSTNLQFLTKNGEGVYEESDKEEDRKATDKKLKENIGNFNEFLMTVVCTGDNIFDIIKAEATERGQLLSRFLGLEIFERKEEVGKKLLSEWKVNSKIDKYSSSDLQKNIDDNNVTIQCNNNEIKGFKSELNIITKDKDKLVKEKQEYLTFYHNDIDPSFVNLTENSFINKINQFTFDINNKKTEIENVKKEYRTDLIVFDQKSYDEQNKIKSDFKLKINEIEQDISKIEREIQIEETKIKTFDLAKNKLTHDIKDIEGTNKVLNNELENLRNVVRQLKEGKACPECGQSIANIDHNEKIKIRTSEGITKKNTVNSNLEKITTLNQEIKKCETAQIECTSIITSYRNSIDEKKISIKSTKDEIEKIDVKMNQLLTVKDNYTANEMILLKKDKCEVELEGLIAKKEKEEDNLTKYRNDLSKIEKNKELDIKIHNKSIEISGKENDERLKTREITSLETKNEELSNQNTENEVLITTIRKEERIAQVFNTYIMMVGKNGISKTIMKNSIPVLNLELAKFLRDSAEFTVEIEINDSNNKVEFWLVDNDTQLKAPLISGSGYEKTIAALSIRIVNSKINALPKPSLLLVDEIFSTVDSENLELIKIFMDKVSATIDNVFMITHNELVKEWADHIVTITKTNNISTAA